MKNLLKRKRENMKGKEKEKRSYKKKKRRNMKGKEKRE